MSSSDFTIRQDADTLYSDHHGWLYGWLRKKLGDPHRAADVAQNTFMRVLVARDIFCNADHSRAWLATTAKRLLIDEARRERIEQAYLAELGELMKAHEGYPSPEETLVAVQALGQLSAVLSAVSPKAQVAFVRHYLDGETLATVAGELDVSVKMVQKYLAQVLISVHE